MHSCSRGGTVNVNGEGSFTSTGSANVATGAALVFNSSYTLADASKLTGVGSYRFTNTLNVTGVVNAPGFELTGGTLAGSQTFNSTVPWTTSNLSTSGTTTIGAAGVLAISTSSAHDYNRRTIVNNGTVNWSDGPIRSGNGGSITNNGAWNDSTATAQYFGDDFGGSLGFTNALGATYTKSGAGTTTFQVPLTNAGIVDVQAGQLSANGIVSGGILSGGMWRVSNGARLTLNSDAAITHNSATVMLTGAGSVFNGINSLTLNDGTFSLQGGRIFTAGSAFTNAGTLALGAGSVFSAMGNLTLSAQSQLVLTLSGATNGAGYDAINATGTLALGGTLQVAFDTNFSPVSGATFALLDATQFTGNFSSVSLPTGYTWNTSLLASQGLLSVTSAIPEPSTYAALVGLGALALAMWRRRLARR